MHTSIHSLLNALTNSMLRYKLHQTNVVERNGKERRVHTVPEVALIGGLIQPIPAPARCRQYPTLPRAAAYNSTLWISWEKMCFLIQNVYAFFVWAQMLRQNQDEIRVVRSQQDTRWSLRHWGGSANWISGIGGVGTQVGKASTGFASVAQKQWQASGLLCSFSCWW